MKLFFKDVDKKLRIIDTGEIDVDLTQQKALKVWLQKETHINVVLPVFTCHNNNPATVEPEVA